MFKSGFVSINGRPNVGKSTLLNALLKQKVAIMSPKAQTTRNKIQGVYTDDECQIIFIDTPGIHKPVHKLGENMNKMAMSATRDVEAILLMVDASAPIGTGDEYVLSMFERAKAPVFLVINKIDLVSKAELIEIIAKWKSLRDFAGIIPISALKQDNLDLFMKTLKGLLPEGPKYYPDGMISDHPESFIIGELIREKILYFTKEEVPHGVAIVIERIRKTKNDVVEIDATIVVERDSQKGIIIGKGGQMLKKIGTASRRDIENLLGSKVLLKTFVRVENNWRDINKYINEFGYKNE